MTNVNEDVSFTDASTLQLHVNENQTAVASVDAVDADGDDLTYTLDGDDAALFTINAQGVLSFIAEPNYESALDVGADNVYNVTIIATDDGGLTASRDVEVTVDDVYEPSPIVYVGNELVATGEIATLNTVTDYHQYNGDLAALGNGQYLAAWLVHLPVMHQMGLT